MGVMSETIAQYQAREVQFENAERDKLALQERVKELEIVLENHEITIGTLETNLTESYRINKATNVLQDDLTKRLGTLQAQHTEICEILTQTKAKLAADNQQLMRTTIKLEQGTFSSWVNLKEGFHGSWILFVCALSHEDQCPVRIRIKTSQ